MLVLLAVSLQVPVQAHTPSSMTLSYDEGTQTLLVEVSHSVSGDHRIAQIQVWKNEVSETTRNYDPPQESTSGMDDTFMVTAGSGDVLRVTATCSISGSITEEITVVVDPTETTTTTTDTTTDTGTTTPPPDLPMLTIIMILIVVFGLLAILAAVFRRR
jgi:hypothetical protein